jgi:hypothetical protein
LTLPILTLCSACGSERTNGGYYDAVIVDSPQPDQRADEIKRGSNFVITIGHHETPLGCKTERMRQTDIAIELPQRPADGQRVELATAKVRYAYGGQMLEFRSATCRGSLVVTSLADYQIDADVDVTCDHPTIGTGEKTFDRRVTLNPGVVAPERVIH